MQLFVGLSAHRGSIKRYPFDILEMPVSSSLPKVSTLKQMAINRPDVVYTLRLMPEVAEGGVTHLDVERAALARDALSARVIVIPTGPRFTPIERNRLRLDEMAKALSNDGCRVAWEPRGVFSPREAERWSEGWGGLLVRDLTRETAPSGDVVYTRLLPLGMGARVTQTSTEILAEQLENAQTAYVIVGGEGAKSVKARLAEHLGVTNDVDGIDDTEQEDAEDE